MFSILLLDSDRKGGEYSVSDNIAVRFDDSTPPRVAGNGPDIIANVLAHWVRYLISLLRIFNNIPQIQNRSANLNRDDWFVREDIQE